MRTLLENANIGANLINTYRAVIEGTAVDVDVPEGTSAIHGYAFSSISTLQSVTIPSTVKSIGSYAFQSCSSLSSLSLSEGLITIQAYAFAYTPLTTIIIPSTVNNIGGFAFQGSHCTELILNNSGVIGEFAFYQQNRITELVIPSGITAVNRCAFSDCTSLSTLIIQGVNTGFTGNYMGQMSFRNCPNLEYVTLPTGFNGNQLDLSSSTLYSVDTILRWLDALKDNTGTTAKTLTIGATNLAKLTNEQIAIATAKNWNLA